MKLIITEEERSRILGMHQNAIKKEFLMEQESGDPEWQAYVASSNNAKTGSVLTSYTPVTPEEAKKGTYGMAFSVESVETGVRDSATYYYQCIDQLPGGDNFKVGQVYDSSFKLKPNIIQQLDESKTDYRKIFTKGCKATYPYKKVDPQVAAAQAKATQDAKTAQAKSDQETKDKEARQAEIAKSDKERGNYNSTIQPKLDDPNFLNPNQEDSVLEQQANEMDDIITNASTLSVDNKNKVVQKLTRLLKVKPQYMKAPHYFQKNPF